MLCDEIIRAYSRNKKTCKQSTVYFMHPSPESMMRGLYLSSVFEAENLPCLWRRNLKVQPVLFCDETRHHAYVLLDISKIAGPVPASEEVCSFAVLWSGAYLICSSTVKELRS